MSRQVRHKREWRRQTLTNTKAIKICLVGLLAVLAGSASFAGDWAGKYLTEDTKGNAFRITLGADGTATGTKHGTTLSGTWTKEGNTAVIKWSTGWITTLSKDGDRYQKTVYRPGASMDSPPTHTIGAEKLE